MQLPDSLQFIALLNDIFDTNTEFVNTHDDKFFEEFKHTQNPQITMLKCSDSRVQMGSFCDAPQNDVFVVRNIGNQIITNEGSIDYGVKILNTPVLLIIGHSGCGAVKAAMGHKTNIESIDRAISAINISKSNVTEAIIEHLNQQVDYALIKYRNKVEDGSLIILGAIYDFKNDLHLGKGRTILININGITDSNMIKQSYIKSVKNLNIIE